MANKVDDQEIQKRYYEQTASDYDSAHAEEHALMDIALEYIIFWAGSLNCSSLLDVGCGTGRAIKSFLATRPDLRIHGIEPVEAMVRNAIEKNGISSDLISVGDGNRLRFPDASFDIVCEFAILHHVKNPETVISEMTRVARKAIFLADSNRFGQGSRISRYTKLFLYKVGLWRAFDYVRTGGKGYMISDGDGLFYSYSVYDSYQQLSLWADRIVLVPIGKSMKQNGAPMSSEWCNPLLTSSAVLLCAFRDT